MDKGPSDTELLERDVDVVLGEDPSPHEFRNQKFRNALKPQMTKFTHWRFSTYLLQFVK